MRFLDGDLRTSLELSGAGPEAGPEAGPGSSSEASSLSPASGLVPGIVFSRYPPDCTTPGTPSHRTWILPGMVTVRTVSDGGVKSVVGLRSVAQLT